MSHLKVIDHHPPEAADAEPGRDAAGDALRARLDGTSGLRYWRSLEELAGTDAFRDWLHREFPRFAAEWDSGLDRRRFLQLASASLALAGLTGCTRQPLEQIVPYVRQPEQVIPGQPLYFATALGHDGYARPVLAESHLGRPTKLEGNPEHPMSLGATDLFTQAAVLDLYDPDRAQAVTERGKIRTRDAFSSGLDIALLKQRALEGEGLRVLTGTVTSPTLGALLETLLTSLPKARWHRFETAGRDAVHQGAEAAFGTPAEVRYDLARADVVVAVDADLLTVGPGAVRYAKDFAARRRVDDAHGHGAAAMNRLYCVESLPSATSTLADHRLSLPPTEVAHFVLALAARLGLAGAAVPAAFADGERAAWVAAVADDLAAHRGRGLLAVGDQVDAEVHTLAHAVNEALGNLGSTVRLTAPVAADVAAGAASLEALVEDIRAEAVDAVVIFGTNVVYGAPADLEVAAALAEVDFSVYLGSHADETAAACRWFVPRAHALESWGDARALDGTATIAQPIIEPLYGGHTDIRLAAALVGRGAEPAADLVRSQWSALDERAWRRALHDGLVADTAAPPLAAAVDAAAARRAAAAIAGYSNDGGLELSFRPDPTVWDGRFANNPWLQECPKPLTKLAWDNALLLSPRTARELGLGDLVAGSDQGPEAPVVRLAVGERSVEVPVWALPGHADGALTLHLGYGRTEAGRVAAGTGVDAGPLRSREHRWRLASGVTVTATGRRVRLASTQDHHSMEGRDIIRVADLDAYRADPHTAFHHGVHVDPDLSLMTGEDFPAGNYAWGLSIDLNACTGCNACVVACQAENNIPTVGKDQVLRGREMHWIRIDRYFAGDADDVQAILHQPVTCMHCEQAPCEVVCPVAATVHSDEGLNDMVYNRCVGTRYCSNNCPYKVRRFNFLLYNDFETPSLQLGRNPDVTVRSRGVMEKCTYCVQRINQARIEAKRDDRRIADGAITTACQQVCPSDAIVFGDVADQATAVSRAKASPRDYSLLGELGTRPRTTYLARLRNPNPALAGSDAGAGGHGAAHGDSEGHG